MACTISFPALPKRRVGVLGRVEIGKYGNRPRLPPAGTLAVERDVYNLPASRSLGHGKSPQTKPCNESMSPFVSQWIVSDKRFGHTCRRATPSSSNPNLPV